MDIQVEINALEEHRSYLLEREKFLDARFWDISEARAKAIIGAELDGILDELDRLDDQIDRLYAALNETTCK